jgi:hypothetical protein
MSPKWPGCVASNSGPEGQMVDSKSGKNKHEAAFCVRFSPDSQFFAVSYADGTVRVCNADLHCAGDAEARTAPSGIPDVERAAGLRAVQPERQRVASASFRFVSARHNPPPPRLRRLAALALIHLSSRVVYFARLIHQRHASVSGRSLRPQRPKTSCWPLVRLLCSLAAIVLELSYVAGVFPCVRRLYGPRAALAHHERQDAAHHQRAGQPGSTQNTPNIRRLAALRPIRLVARRLCSTAFAETATGAHCIRCTQ